MISIICIILQNILKYLKKCSSCKFSSMQRKWYSCSSCRFSLTSWIQHLCFHLEVRARRSSSSSESYITDGPLNRIRTRTLQLSAIVDQVYWAVFKRPHFVCPHGSQIVVVAHNGTDQVLFGQRFKVHQDLCALVLFIVYLLPT